MVTANQVSIPMGLINNQEKTLKTAAAKASMSEKAALRISPIW
jgi:hypothetical protein